MFAAMNTCRTRTVSTIPVTMLISHAGKNEPKMLTEGALPQPGRHASKPTKVFPKGCRLIPPGTPGELRCDTNEEIEALPLMPRVSPHDPAVREALAITRFLGHGPGRVLLIGVIPTSLEVTTELSARVRASASAAVGLVTEMLAKAGVIAVRRAMPRLRDVGAALSLYGFFSDERAASVD